ncbi:MAG TPA: helix-turn-helix domain-containing protein [Dehalococcoidia bacterium]|nr:helix-turn-helix domain-containing protein [Dehalococcoidia bacterium]
MTRYRSNQDGEVPLTLTVGQAAGMLGISEYLAWQMIKQGKLPTIRFGRLVRIPRARLMAMVNGEPANT